MSDQARRAPVSIYPILSINFVGTLGFSIVLPFLVFLVTRLGGNALIYGIMGATYSAFQLIGAPILGRWSDRYGRRKILLLSQLGTLASWAIFLGALFLPATVLWNTDSGRLGAFTITLPLAVLFFARALDGMTGGNVSVANAYLADITDEQDRSGSFGKMAVASNLGFVMGPAIAGVLGATAWGETVPVLAALAISAIATLLIVFGLPESNCCPLAVSPERPNVRKMLGQEQKDCYELQGEATLTFRAVLGLKSIPLLLMLNFLVFLGFNLFYVAWPVHAAGSLGWSLTGTGIFFSAMGLMMAVVQGPVMSRASAIFRDRTLVIVGSFLLAASFLFFRFSNLAVIYTGAAVLALGNGIMWPSLQGIVSKSTDAETQGSVQGLATSGSAVASIVGLLAGGVLYGIVGSSVFVIAALIAASVGAMGFKLSREAGPAPT